MARKKVEPVIESEVSSGHVCGDCGNAYGYCWPVAGGAPYFCRCPLRPYALLRVKESACCSFVVRNEPRPERVSVRVSVSRDEGPMPEKVVPLFREGERRPWKFVPVSEIPPGGLSWDGSPVKNDSSTMLDVDDIEW